MKVTDWSKYPNFSRPEFQCKFTGLCEMDVEFMDALQALRSEFGLPMRITSGYRHPTHPVEARKQRSDGEHTQGRCADIATPDSRYRYHLIRLALKYGFTRIGIARNFVHLGIGGTNLPNGVIWHYM